MEEVGIDMVGHRSELVSKYVSMEFDLLVTVCDHPAEFPPGFLETIKKYIGVLLISQR